jgi:hypothetical protein
LSDRRVPPETAGNATEISIDRPSRTSSESPKTWRAVRTRHGVISTPVPVSVVTCVPSPSVTEEVTNATASPARRSGVPGASEASGARRSKPPTGVGNGSSSRAGTSTPAAAPEAAAVVAIVGSSLISEVGPDPCSVSMLMPHPEESAAKQPITQSLAAANAHLDQNGDAQNVSAKGAIETKSAPPVTRRKFERNHRCRQANTARRQRRVTEILSATFPSFKARSASDAVVEPAPPPPQEGEARRV